MIHDALFDIQQKLKAPKDNTNNFGGYNYRSCEDILKAVKPLLKEHRVTLTLSDEVVEVGGRVYIRATATLSDGKESISTTAFAREEEQKKGMDSSQISGSCSSYSRKYAVSGLLCIDGEKDSDATNTHGKDAPEPLGTVKLDNKGEAVCEHCGRKITPYVTADGKEISVPKHCSGSVKKFGSILCLDCISAIT